MKKSIKYIILISLSILCIGAVIGAGFAINELVSKTKIEKK